MKSFSILTETLTVEEYLELSEDEKANIERSCIVPASNKDFGGGGIRVAYKYPKYKALD